MPNILQVLTPQALQMLESINRNGSFSKAASELGLVPSALTYRVRQLEDTLDVLLFDRSSRQAKITAAGLELLQEGVRLLDELGAVANRVKRVAAGWEPKFSIVVDGLIQMPAMFDLCNKFFDYFAKHDLDKKHVSGTKLSFLDGRLRGTYEELITGKADLAVGVIENAPFADAADLKHEAMGEVELVQVVAASHPLAAMTAVVTDAEVAKYRVIVVSDSARRLDRTTRGVLDGQDTLTVSSVQDKLIAQLHGLGVGYLPVAIAKPYLDSGALVEVKRLESRIKMPLHFIWRAPKPGRPNKVLNWWLEQLRHEHSQKYLLGNTYS